MNFQDITIEKSNDIDDVDFPSPRSPCIQLWQSQQTSVLRVPLNAPLKPARTHYQGRGNYIVRGGAAFPWWRVIACHVTHRSSNSAEWMMICFYVIFPFLFRIFTNVLAMAWNIWYSDCQIHASGSILLFKHLYNDRVSWAVCAMGAAVLVCAADAVQRIGSVGFTTSMFTTREFIHFSRNT